MPDEATKSAAPQRIATLDELTAAADYTPHNAYDDRSSWAHRPASWEWHLGKAIEARARLVALGFKFETDPDAPHRVRWVSRLSVGRGARPEERNAPWWETNARPWWEPAELGPQGQSAGQARAVICRACGAREELAEGDAMPLMCPECLQGLVHAFEDARDGIGDERRLHRVDWDRLEALMYRATQAMEAARLLDALAAVKAAEDLEYELTSDCAWSGVLEALLCATLGVWDEDVHNAWEGREKRAKHAPPPRCGDLDGIGRSARCVLDAGHPGAHTGAHWVEWGDGESDELPPEGEPLH